MEVGVLASTENLPTLGEEQCVSTSSQSVNALLWETRMMLDFLGGGLTLEHSWLRGSRLQ